MARKKRRRESVRARVRESGSKDNGKEGQVYIHLALSNCVL